MEIIHCKTLLRSKLKECQDSVDEYYIMERSSLSFLLNYLFLKDVFFLIICFFNIFIEFHIIMTLYSAIQTVFLSKGFLSITAAGRRRSS